MSKMCKAYTDPQERTSLVYVTWTFTEAFSSDV